ncbi:unnamed protein product [Porites lobata]|uniref:Golgi apparatus protein 1 n=2 Tax=Porites lobata TaxID=104759 RepID=A0ABN8QP73_9CNID|nr:unnamed protein product [Porites lobata]
MLWEYKTKFSKDQQFENKVKDKFCAADLKKLPECAVQGKIIPCLLEHRRNLTVPSCKHMMTRMQAIFFSDYRLIENFLDDCSKDVHNFSCGRLQTEEDEEDIHSQNEVLECLEEHQEKLSQQCQKQIYRLAELSSDDYHLDRPLFYACKDDRERFCEQVPSGEGRVYKCLKKHKDEETMSDECRDKLTERQKLEAKDPKANYPLMKNCLEFYRQYKDKYECERGKTKHGALANILLCLEKAVEDDQKVSGKCQAEMFDLRQQLMDDYSINPEIVAKCDLEIQSHCRNGEEKGGKTIDCLMSLAEENEGENNVIRAECVEAIETLLEETGAGTDYRIDHTLYAACEPVVQTVCKDKGKKEGDVMVLSCLMENLHTDNMIPECEEQLLHLEFFIARDFKLDPEVKRLCKDDAKAVCGASSLDDQESYPNSLVISCLYRNSVLDTQTKVSPKCAAHVQRVMHQRAVDVHLMPEIQIACVQDLGKHCSEKVEKGEKRVIEIADIITWIEAFTVFSDSLPHLPLSLENLNQYKFVVIPTARRFSAEKKPQPQVQLFQHELCHHPNPDKVAYVVQGLRDGFHLCFNYSTSLNSATGNMASALLNPQVIDNYLQSEVQTGRVAGPFAQPPLPVLHEIQCLQEKFDELGEKCKQAIGNFTEEEGEDYKLDRTMVRACSGMVTKFCGDVVAQGNTEGVLPCLVEHKNDHDMDEKCRASIEHWQLIEMKDFRFSAEFKKACKKDAQQLCPKVTSKYELVECLSKKIRDAIINEDEPEVSEKCRRELRVEKEEESEDVRFDPIIIAQCMGDINRLCANAPKGQARVLECLRDHRRELSGSCKDALFEREEEEIEDPELDYKLRRPCKKMIKMFCNDVEPSEMFSCLKENKHKPEFDKSCSDMITKRQIRQSQDVRLNPQLMKFCRLDIPKFCKDIPTGEGKTIGCLKKNYERLSEECQEYTKRLIRQAAKDFRLDTRLVEECEGEIKKFCAGSPPSAVEECLKSHLGSVTRKNCRVEIVRQMREGRTDIQADPVLYKACANDIKRHCSDIPFGKGKVMKCLLEAHDSNPARFDRECLIHLSSRLKMWELAAKILPPETLGDLALAISSSPSKNYFFIIFATCLALIFVGGLVFGRLSKRIKREIKDR